VPVHTGIRDMTLVRERTLTADASASNTATATGSGATATATSEAVATVHVGGSYDSGTTAGDSFGGNGSQAEGGAEVIVPATTTAAAESGADASASLW